MAKFGGFQSQYFGQVCFLKNNLCKKHCKNRGFSTFFKIKKKRAQIFKVNILAKLALFFGTPNLAKILTLTWPQNIDFENGHFFIFFLLFKKC